MIEHSYRDHVERTGEEGGSALNVGGVELDVSSFERQDGEVAFGVSILVELDSGPCDTCDIELWVLKLILILLTTNSVKTVHLTQKIACGTFP